MARPSNSEQRRAQIADAMIGALADGGYERATIAAIAKRAGLRSGLVHYHFETKQEILLLAVERLAGRISARYQARCARAGPQAIDRLLAFVDAHVALGDDADPAAVAAWVAVGVEALGQPRVRVLYAALMRKRSDELRHLVGDSLRAAGRSAHGARDMAAAILSAIEGAYQLSATVPELLPRGFAARSLRKMVRGLVAAS